MLERVTEHLPSPDSALPRQRFWTVRARHIIIAAGALERHIAFGDNDRPGVMSAASARAYLHRFGVLPGARIVVATNNDSAYPVAAGLAQAGAGVTLLDARATVGGAMRRLAGDYDVALKLSHAPLKVRGGRGVKALALAADDGHGWSPAGRAACDLVLVSGGWSPTIHLNSQRGAKPIWNAESACFLAGETDEPITTAGVRRRGFGMLTACEESGKSAGLAAVKSLGAGVSMNQNKTTNRTKIEPSGWETPLRPLYEIRVKNRRLKSFVDLQNDVTADDIRLAHREGFVSVEHLKRYTTLGMSTDGGKVGNVIGLALMAEASGREIADVGSTVFRPPYTPISLGALRGRSVDAHFRPLRRTPMHDWNLAHGAVMTMAGLWDRPWYFPQKLPADSVADDATDAFQDGYDDDPDFTLLDETIEQAYIREAATVRETVGLCDVTTLGKIAIQGPDATTFLDQIYTNPFAKLAVGRARYGIMLRDDGIVMDDGTTWRLGDADYFMTTTTAHAGKVMAWLEELLQTRWSELRVTVTSVTDQWAGCAVAGPQSRAVLAECVADSAVVGDDKLPFMGVVETTLTGDIPCRIARISFSGEMAFEVYVPSDFAAPLMDQLWTSAQSRDGCLYGTEALGTLRIEKGHVTGAELDGRVTIDDAGLGKMASPNKVFVGDALRKRAELQREDRPQLVAIVPKDRSETFNAGAILCRAEAVSGLGDGWITAVTHSPVFGHWLGIGFIAGGHSAWQERRVIAADPVRDAMTEVEIVSPHLYDPGGERMRG